MSKWWLLLGLLAPGPALACASCACGDPMLSALGLELPFEGRLRLGAIASTRSESAGVARVDQVQSEEQRMTLALAWSPLDVLTVGLAIPLVNRRAVEVSGRRHLGFGVGDVELRSRVMIASFRGEGTRQVISLHGGADLPVMPLLSGGAAPLPMEAQPGSGSFSGLAGASYALHAWPWSFYASASGRLSTSGYLGEQPGAVALATISAQAQIQSSWALGASFDGRIDAPARHDGVEDDSSGGVFAVISPTILFSPATDWLISAAVRVPINEGLNGEHHEGVSVTLGVTCDI